LAIEAASYFDYFGNCHNETIFGSAEGVFTPTGGLVNKCSSNSRLGLRSYCPEIHAW